MVESHSTVTSWHKVKQDTKAAFHLSFTSYENYFDSNCWKCNIIDFSSKFHIIN